MKKPTHDLTHEELDPQFNVGAGNPLSPYNDQKLSEDDEKSIDDKGRPTQMGKLWSKSGTGVYLVVGLHTQESSSPVRPLKAKVDIDLSKALSKGWSLCVGTSIGKPTFLHPIIGACLELPDDLAADPIKRQYVVEWLVNTVDEAMKDRSLSVPRSKRPQVAAAIAEAANASIARVF